MQLELDNSRFRDSRSPKHPGIGSLFGNRARNVVKKELVILIKPTVIRSELTGSRTSPRRRRLRGMGGGAPTPRSQ